MLDFKEKVLNNLIALMAIGSVIGGAYAKPPSRITGGEFAGHDEFPGVVRLEVTVPNNRLDCGGSIIGHRHILTAGHCLEGAISVKVFGGTNVVNDPDAVVRNSVKIFRHPNYNFQTIGKLDIVTNDIGIVVIDKDVNLDGRLEILSLPTDTPAPNTTAVIAGWGRTSNFSFIVSPILKKADAVVMSESDCNLSGLPEKFCAHSQKASACSGDSGSPLMNDAGQVIGLLSTSLCFFNEPQVYANVHHHLAWINSILQRNFS